jgi:hypothetical protein
MSEGLSPLEANKELERHQHENQRIQGRQARIVQVSEALVLALVTITAAWTGFAAAKWGTESRLDLAASSSARIEANRAAYAAGNLRNFDSSTFNAWFIAYTLDDPQKMAIAEARFRPAFKVAFDAWLATHPATNPDAAPGPTYMPQYKLPQVAKEAKLNAEANAHSAAGDHAGIVGDEYVRITVVLAGVLFLVGIGSTFSLRGARYGLAGLGAVLLVGAVILIALLPPPPL